MLKIKYTNINKASFGLAIICTIFLISGIIWIEENRIGQPLDIDEAGYLSIATSQYYALTYSGVSGWLAAVYSPSIQAPLVTAATSLIYYFTGINEFVPFVVQLLCAIGTIITTYLIAARLANRRAGIIAALLIASCPGIINYSRSYYFVSPTTLIYTVAIYALIRSERFSNIAWSYLFGFMVGIMPLTRTMTVAFLPGFCIVALSCIVATNNFRKRRLFLFLSSLMIGLTVSLTWYYCNGILVWNYLRGYGYGTHASEYGIKTSLNIIANRISVICNNADLFIPHLSVLLIGFCIIIIWTILRLSKKENIELICKNSFLSIIVINLFSFFALQSTENVGSGFYCPLFPSIFAIIASFIMASIKNFKIQRICVAVTIAIYIITSAPFFSLQLKIANPVNINVPYIGILKFTDGSGIFLNYLKAGKIKLDSKDRLDHKKGLEWLEFNKLLSGEINTVQKPNSLVVFAFRDHLCNVNTVNLQELKLRKKTFSMDMIDPSIIPYSVDGYKNWIESKKICNCIIVTSSDSGTFEPLVNPVYMREALYRNGFLEVAKIQSPDGQYVTLWSIERG